MDYVGFLILAAIAAAGGVAGHMLAARRLKGPLAMVWAVLGLVSLMMASLFETTPGWDALLYGVILYGACAPAAVGLLIGSLTGWNRATRGA